jgi:DNA-binding transcriptional LysR family regulator
MRYKLEDILTFLTVIEAGGLTAAARRLGVAKSVVSKRISDLERSLGATLLRRSARGVVPTDAGAAFYGRARDILAELDDAAASAAGAGELSGLMRVAGPLSFGTLHLAPVLVDFLARYPRVELALHLNDSVIDIIREGYDLAVRIGRQADGRDHGRGGEQPRPDAVTPRRRTRRDPQGGEHRAENRGRVRRAHRRKVPIRSDDRRIETSIRDGARKERRVWLRPIGQRPSG